MMGVGEPGTGRSAPMPMPTQAVSAVGEKTGGALALAAMACCMAAVVARLANSPSERICRFVQDVRIVLSSTTALEVGLAGFGDVRVLVVVILVRIFRTDAFRYFRRWHIGQCCGPRGGEDAFIFYCHMKLHELAAVLAEDIAVEQPIFLLVPLERIFHVVIGAQP